MIIANRRHLLNGNSFILGVSGAGKSFTAKEEMTNIILTDPNADVNVMYASVVCFFTTALFECFIKLSYQRIQNQGGVLQIVKQDFLSSMQYISKKQTSISKMLLLTAFSRFFVMGITIVGLPFLVRTVLGFNAKYYGAAESALAVATILGSIAAGVLAEKLKKWLPQSHWL